MLDKDQQQGETSNKLELLIDPEYRGYVCNRLLSTSLPPLSNDSYLEKLAKYKLNYNESIGGELEYLAMSPGELVGKVLDVGIGGGRSILQGVQNGIDIYGIDIALKARVGAIHPGSMSMAREQIARENLENLISVYPDRVFEADAAQMIPFPDNLFKTVIACISLPTYARNQREVVTSVLEMIRVAQDKVVFTSGYFSVPKSGESSGFGVGINKFNFCLVDFLNSLKPLGIDTAWKVVINPDKEYSHDIVSAHLDVSKKNQELLTNTSSIF